MWRPVYYLYFQSKYRQSTDLCISYDLLFVRVADNVQFVGIKDMFSHQNCNFDWIQYVLSSKSPGFGWIKQMNQIDYP